MNFIRNFLHDTSGGKCRDVEDMVDTLKKNNYIKAVSCEIKDLKSKFLRPDGQKRDQRINGLKRGALQEVVINDETVNTKYIIIYTCMALLLSPSLPYYRRKSAQSSTTS